MDYGDSRYQTKRGSNYDMQRNFHASFDPIPAPEPGNTMDPDDLSRARGGYGGSPADDPLLAYLKGISTELPKEVSDTNARELKVRRGSKVKG